MPRLFDKKQAAPGTSPVRSERAAMPGLAGSSVSNSAMLSALGYTGGSNAYDPQAATAALRAQRPAAEAEADRLSAGISAATPEAVKAEMGERLGADLSAIRFHDDAASVRQGDRIAARAWTRGGDVYFGDGGFDPAVAAHELVHTVQQGAAEGQTAAAAPAGAVQMMPNPFKRLRERFRARRGSEDSSMALDGEETADAPTPDTKPAPPPFPVGVGKAPSPAQTSVIVPQKAAPVAGAVNPQLSFQPSAPAPSTMPSGLTMPANPLAPMPKVQQPSAQPMGGIVPQKAEPVAVPVNPQLSFQTSAPASIRTSPPPFPVGVGKAPSPSATSSAQTAAPTPSSLPSGLTMPANPLAPMPKVQQPSAQPMGGIVPQTAAPVAGAVNPQLSFQTSAASPVAPQQMPAMQQGMMPQMYMQQMNMGAFYPNPMMQQMYMGAAYPNPMMQQMNMGAAYPNPMMQQQMGGIIPQKAAPAAGTPQLNLRVSAPAPGTMPAKLNLQGGTSASARVYQQQQKKLAEEEAARRKAAEAAQKEAAHQAEVKEQASKKLTPDEVKALQEKRPWEMSEVDLKRNRFNPGLAEDVAEVQKKIFLAKTPREAYQIFSAYAGNEGGRLISAHGLPKNPKDVDLIRFKDKLMNMARMVHDYPELKGVIGNMRMINGQHGAIMKTYSTQGGKKKAEIGYNPWFDSVKRTKVRDFTPESSYHSAGLAYAGTHELGHVLNSLVLKQKDPNDPEMNVSKDWKFRVTANEMLQEAIGTGPGYRIVKQQEDIPDENDPTRIHHYLPGQIDTQGSQLHRFYKATSGYGETDAAEFFAEAVADVYANGNRANPASIRILKSYEKRRGAYLQRKQQEK